MKTLVIGLGNLLLTDDGVGLRVAQQLRPRLQGREGIQVEEDYRGGLGLMEQMIGYDRAIVVDAIRTGAEPGTIHCLCLDSVPTQHSASAHDVNLSTALALGRQAGAHLPATENILLIGIEAEDVWSFSERCSPRVQAAIPRAVATVMKALTGEQQRQVGYA